MGVDHVIFRRLGREIDKGAALAPNLERKVRLSQGLGRKQLQGRE